VADIAEALEQQVDDLARGTTAAGGDEADAARVALGVRVVQGSRLRLRVDRGPRGLGRVQMEERRLDVG